jgi:hypothetical protein
MGALEKSRHDVSLIEKVRALSDAGELTESEQIGFNDMDLSKIGQHAQRLGMGQGAGQIWTLSLLDEQLLRGITDAHGCL